MSDALPFLSRRKDNVVSPSERGLRRKLQPGFSGGFCLRCVGLGYEQSSAIPLHIVQIIQNPPAQLPTPKFALVVSMLEIKTVSAQSRHTTDDNNASRGSAYPA